MQTSLFHLRIPAFVAGVVLVFSGWACADPPSRVARLGYMSGAVSFSPAGETDWDHATINRPLTTGDRLWAEPGARAEVQVGGATIRLDAGTAIAVLNLDDRIAQLQLTQGALNVRVRRLEPNQVFEVDTPNLAFTLRRPGAYRIDVDAAGNAPTIVVRQGQGEAYGDGAAYVVDARQPYRFTGTGLRDYQVVAAPRLDEFDRWASGRDSAYDNSGSARYVSPGVVGYQDLDANGRWRVDATYGNVWVPSRVAAGWAPYRDGHWTWIDPWGWTWVDDAPWGFAVSHYGRWAHLGGTWGWVPGPVQTRAYYAPALVAFVGGVNFQLAISSGNVGGVAWFPLAPHEVYRPAYPVSRGYYENINRSNTVINNTVINNTYNSVTNIVYANRRVPGAVIAVPATAFVQSQPVSRTAVRVAQDRFVSGPVAAAPHVTPTQQSVRGAADQGGKPPARVFERPVVARTAPPAAHVGFAAQQPQLSAKPGQPLGDAQRKDLKRGEAAPAPIVRIVAPTPDAPRALRPLPPAVKPGELRAKPEEPKARAAPTIPERPRPPDTPTSRAAPAQTAPPVSAIPTAPVPAPRGKFEPQTKPAMSDKPDKRELPVVPPRATSQGLAHPQPTSPPPVSVPPPAAPPPIQRARPEQVSAPTAAPPGQRPKPELSPSSRPVEPRPQVAVPKLPVAQPQPAPAAVPPGQRAKPEPAPAPRPAEPRAPVAAPKPPPAQAQPVSKAHEAPPEAGKDKKQEPGDLPRDDEKRKRNP